MLLGRGRHKAGWPLMFEVALGSILCAVSENSRSFLVCFTSGTFCSCPFVLCSQVIRPLLCSLGPTSTLYPRSCWQISLMFYIFSQLPSVTSFVDFPAVVPGSHGSSVHPRSPSPTTFHQSLRLSSDTEKLM